MAVVISLQNVLINMAKSTKLLQPNADYATVQLDFLPNAKFKK